MVSEVFNWNLNRFWHVIDADAMSQEHVLQLQASCPVPGGGELSGTAVKASVSGGSSGGTISATAPLDPQVHDPPLNVFRPRVHIMIRR